MLRIGAPHFVHAEVEPLFRHLRREHDAPPGVYPVEDSLLERGAVGSVVRYAAKPIDLEDKGIVIGLKRSEEVRAQARSELEHGDAVVERAEDRGKRSLGQGRIYPGGCPSRPCTYDAIVANVGERREVHAGKGIRAHGSLLTGARSGNGDATEHDRYVARRVVERIEQALVEVELRIGKRARHGALRAGEHDGLRASLDEVRERGGGIGHGVGPVQDEESVESGVALFDGARDAEPVRGAHVGAVDIHELQDLELAQALDLGHACGELSAGEGGGEAVSVFGGGDGAPGGDEKDSFH